MPFASIINDGFEWGSPNLPGTWSTVSSSASNTVPGFEDSICVGRWFDSSSTHNQIMQPAITFGNIVGEANGLASTANLTLKFDNAHKFCEFNIKAVLPDTPVMGQSNLPSSQTLTTAFVNFNMSDLAGYEPFGFWNPPDTVVDISAVVEEFLAHPNFNSGDDLTLVFEYVDNATADSLTGIQASDGATPTTFEYTIVSSFNPSITSVSGDDIIVNGETFEVLTQDLTNVSNHRVYKGVELQSLTASPISGGFSVSFTRTTVGYGTGFTYAVDSSEGTVTRAVELRPAAGYDYIIASNPSDADNSFFFEADPPAQNGDQIEFQVTTKQNNDTASVTVAGEPRITGSGDGFDSFDVAYYNLNGKTWQNGLLATFGAPGYLSQNPIRPMNINISSNRFTIPLELNELEPKSVTITMNSFTADFEEDLRTGFESVNSPSLKVIDTGTTLNLYVNRDNTAEFQFLESGQAVDLGVCTRIELKIGLQSFSDSDFQYASKFTKLAKKGVLEVQLGELGLASGEYSFYFILYTPDHKFGVVWNEKTNFKLVLKEV